MALSMTPLKGFWYKNCRIRIFESLSASILGIKEREMAEKGKGDKSKKEPQKKAVLSLKEKRKLKNEKKNNK